MDIQRAKQILLSDEHYDVQLNGEPVWIDEINMENRSVSVHPVDNASDVRTVNADQLQEV